MRLKYDFEIVEMGDEIVAVPVGQNTAQVHGILKLNKEGKEIIDLIGTNISEEQIVDALALKYSNDKHDLAKYVAKVIGELGELGLLEN